MLKFVNSCLLISFLLQLISSLIMMFPVGGKVASLAYDIHVTNGKIFFALALWHIYLNRKWIFNVLLKRRKKQ